MVLMWFTVAPQLTLTLKTSQDKPSSSLQLQLHSEKFSSLFQKLSLSLYRLYISSVKQTWDKHILQIQHLLSV